MIMKLSVSASTVDREVNSMDWTSVQKHVVLPNSTSKMLSMNSVTNTSFLVYRVMQSMKINICLVLPWLVRSSPNVLWKLPAKKALSLSATVQPEKEMTRSVSNSVSKLLLLISRSSLLGEMTNGTWIPVNPRLNTAAHMVSTFLLLQIPVTAVTVTCGTSAMKVWNWKILPTNQITNIFSYSVPHRKKLRMKVNMSQ